MFDLMRITTAILTLGCFLSLIQFNQAIQNETTNTTSDFAQTASTISLKSVQFLTTLAGNGDEESSPPLSSSTLTSILKRDRPDIIFPDEKVSQPESRIELDEEEDRDEDEHDNDNGNENENETVLAKLDMSSQMGSGETIDRNDSNSLATGSTPSVAAVYQDGPQREFTGSPTKGGKNFHHSEDNSFTMSSASDLNGHQQHHEICDFCIYDGEGNFTSYGYPLPYRANLNCSYRVQRGKGDDVCQLDLIFHDFDVPVTSVAGVGPKIGGINECHEDYLQVGNKRYCGSEWRDRTEIIPFPMGQKEVTFYFVSNERVSGRGFWVEVRKRPGTCYTKKMMKGCEERYSDPEFYITSPQFPSGYPNNAECTYYIRRSDQSVCGLEIKFLHFDLEPVSNGGNECLFDYVQIDGEKFCGTMTPQTVKQFKFIEDQKVIVFHSDKQVPRSGFHMLVRQLKQCSQGPSLPPPPTCNICTNERRGLLVSYGYPNQYRNNLHCTYSIEKYDSSICSLELHFMDFEVMPSLDCSDDYLTIDGVQYCGTTLHSTKRMVEFGANKTIEMIFHSNPTSNSRGFSARYRQVSCSSMNMIGSESPKNGHRDITTSSTSSKDIRPQSTPSSVDPSSLPPISSSTTSLTTLTTPSIGSSTSATDTNGKMVALNCDKTYHEKHFLLQSFNFSNNYPNNMECTYLIFRNTSKVCYLELTFLQFDVEPSPQCQYDYLEVNSVRLCGTLQRETTRTYIFNDPEKMIKFHSDNSSNRSGFLIQAEQLECHGDAIIRNMSDGTANIPGAVGTTSVSDPAIPFFPCDQLFSDQSFEIISPLYPSPYPKNSDCVYMVKKIRPNICRLEVTFFDFDMQGINDYGYCANDYLDFNGIRMCGSVEKGNVRNFYFPESKFSIRFHADSLLSGRGFRLGLRQTDCDVNTIELKLPNSGSSSLPPATSMSPSPPPISKTNPPATSHNGGTKRIHTNQCDQVFGENFVEIMSPRYPANYPSSISCQYTIVKQTNAGPICQLEVNILELELDESSSCQGDFLDFEHEIICGSVASKTVKVFPFDRSEFLIRFKSDSQEVPAGRRAFHIQVRQRECPDGFSVTPPKTPSIGTTNDPTQETTQMRPEYCSSTIKSIRFELKSQNFPANYENNLDCTYIIQRNHDDICNMDLFFIDFELEDDKDCRFDYVSIQGRKYCGTVKSGTIQTYAFSNQSEIIIRFQTDRANSAKGFHIRGVQRECDPKYDPQNNQHQNMSSHHQTTITLPSTSTSPHHLPVAPSICEVCFASREGVIKSYNFPNSYPADLSCNYRIAGLQDHCAVYLKFENFELEEPKNGLCTEDYLEIEDVRYCGNQLSGIQKLLDFHGDPKEIFMRFHSNSYLSGRGFKILYAQIPCSNLIAINQVPITKTTQHHTGYGQHPDRQIPQIVAGSEPISVLEAKDRNEPDSPASRIPCDLVVFDSKFEISTPGFPFAYPVRSDCLFSIRRANYNVCKLKLEFDTFDLESSPHCRSDQLEIEGEKLCGSLPSNSTREYEFHNYKLALRFRSDEQGSSRGFLIRGQQIECPPGSKQSGPYPANSADVPTYTPPDDSYPYKSHNYPYGGSILPPANLPNPSSSSVNYEIPDYHDSKGRPDSPQSFPSSSSSSSGSSNGYPSDSAYNDRYPSGASSSAGESQASHESDKGSYYPQSSYNQNSCDKTIVDSFFDIKSPGYPFRYPASRCSLVIKKSTPEVCHLDLMFVGFDVGSSSCSSDYFAVDGERFCGTIESGQVKTFRFDLPEKFLFFSGDLSQGIGYHIRGRQVECSPPHYHSSSLPSSRPGSIGSVSSSISRSSESTYSHSSNNLIDRSSISSAPPASSPLPYCDQTFATGEFTIMSPNHPNSYPNNLYCRYTVIRSSTSACALDLTFKNFDLEETSDCSKDYLEIDGSRVCGLLPPLHQRRYNYFPHEKEKTFIFRSDSYGSKSGFSIHVTQATGCRSYSDLMHRSEQSEEDGSTNTKPSRSQCNQCMKDVMGQITSDGYPSRYSDNTDCNYRISAAGPQYCKVLIYLRDLDIESSEACDRDYLFVEGQRLCNTNFRKSKEMTIYYPEFGPREITFSFHSDGKGTGRGFFLDFIQQSCSVSAPSMPVQHASTMSRSPTYPANHVAKATIEEIVETRVQVLDQRPPITQYQQHRQQNSQERTSSDRSFNSRSHRAQSDSASVYIPHPPSQMLRTHLAHQSSRGSQSNIHPDPDLHSVSARDTIYVEEASRRKN